MPNPDPPEDGPEPPTEHLEKPRSTEDLPDLTVIPTEEVPLDDLRPHPENYRDHPEDQLVHLEESLRKHGWYRDVVVARDGTILAGHGIVLAARRRGAKTAPVKRLDLDPHEPGALAVLAGDNEVGRLAEIDDRKLSELLKEVQESDEGLLGTGYDEMMLANLLYTTRPKGEIESTDAAKEWVGLPDFVPAEDPWRLMVSFRTPEDRERFIKEKDLEITKTMGAKMASAWWPAWEERRNDSSLQYEEVDGPEPLADLLDTAAGRDAWDAALAAADAEALPDA